MNVLDVAVIGAGPIGLACAIELKKLGLTYAVFDKGCLVNSLYHYPQNMTFFSTAERLEIGGLPFVSLQPKPGRAEALEYYRRVAVHFGLRLRLFEGVNTVQKNEAGDFILQTDKDVYTAKKVIVATGFYDKPVMLGVPGEDLPKVTHYYKEPHFYAFQQVVVVGGNNSAVDAALECWRKGASVTLVMMEKEIGQRVKYWVRPDIVNRIEEGSIRAYTSSTIAAIRQHEVDIATPDGTITLPNDRVIAMTGYKPDFSFLKNMGVSLSDDGKFVPQYDPETMETNVQG
ncbi:MAG TPA: YpdA family putative bacillithiol disulfide reductase, partial [Phnomibacter sp.]|nr:YpdA family putative bacillithiol disulfide reductase [Phnomibacter sp.]